MPGHQKPSSAGNGLTLRQLTEADWSVFEARINDAFGSAPDEAEPVPPPPEALERMVGAFTPDGELVGTGVNHTMLLTLPGGNRVPVAGVAGISVAPTHRRQGIMSALINWLVADAEARGEVASVLTASEGSIYWKRGYGPATWAMTGEVDSGARLFPASSAHLPVGIVRMIREGDAAIAAMADIHERACAARSGSINRPAHLWSEVFRSYTEGHAHWRLAVHTAAEGIDDGYAFYGMVGDWTTHSTSGQWAHVHELTTVGPVAHRALWQHLLDLDLSRGVKVTRIGQTDPIKLMLNDTRAFRVTGMMDRLWVRPLDVPRLFNARQMGHGSPVVLEITGPLSTEHFVLSSDGCEPTTPSRPADLSMTVAGLGAVSLGGTSAVDLTVAGRVVELKPGSAAALDSLLRTSPAPIMTTAF